ncbi:AAA family ATPase [Umboniibacter marinipuniceus]|uniref:MoxR-like ATPase n=1 Tax=Umboniibacter marinipuniceus TaxID=569599 RepID=A0A3M0A617_9GAMM|nr:MoxR family ATPase [Umboniibacter marinipuniceus]RMA78959.1 MoxR-like ATPase [Umboniibacter marinipuniceus]
MIAGDVLKQLDAVVLGKSQQTKLALSCLLANGHLLIEDLPGLGKTTLAQAMAKTLGLKFKRAQFTSDMLPADIIGVSIFDTAKQAFKFHPGPVFSQMLLADEINRTHPKTQSALLEAMEERQVSVDGKRYRLPEPFFVVASQNPLSQDGTFNLPESQLDRFMMRIELGYPSLEAERALLQGRNPRQQIPALPGLGNAETIAQLQAQVSDVKASEALTDYALRLVRASRALGGVHHGLSPRGGLALIQAAKAWSFVEGRQVVLPDDIQAVFHAVVGHRLLPHASVAEALEASTKLLASVDVIAA